MRGPANKSKPVSPKASAQAGPINHQLPGATKRSEGGSTLNHHAWLLAVLLGLVTMALYWPATGHDFVYYDDNTYVKDNLHVTGGLTLENVEWAFGSGYASNWHPLTWMSHMLDCQLYGLKPGGHHLTSVLLHALNAALVFLLLRGLTGAMWRSAMVAALFAWHPLHVESVAWAAERKDVLSACFGLLTLCAYGRYAAGRNIEHRIRRRSEAMAGQASNTEHRMKAAGKSRTWLSALQTDGGFYYGLALVFFALGLMSKPMLVTWPFVMLLLDWWPLNRFTIDDLRFTNFRSLLSPVTRHSSPFLEKIPFFILAAAAGAVTFIVQQHGGAVKSEGLPLDARIGNALVSYCRYLGKLFWPVKLAVFYPYPGHYWPLAEVLVAGGFLLGISALCFALRRWYPFLLVGWLWFVGTLVPVIGLVQVGKQAMADRYTYIPSLGVLIAVIWGAYELTRRWRDVVIALSLAGSAAILLCLMLTWRQLGYWQDGETLFRHALDVTEDNYIARYNLGTVILDKGQTAEAVSQLREAVHLGPDDPDAHDNLGIALSKQGRMDDAIGQFQEAIRLNPDAANAHNNLGNALAGQGRIDEAISQFEEAVRLNPDDAGVHDELGIALSKLGRIDEAISQFQEVIRLAPDHADTRNELGIALARKGRIDEAINQFQEVLRLNPDDAGARDNLVHALRIKNAPTAPR